MTECQHDSWEGMYRDGWGTLPTKASYEHPAKFAKNLIFAIVQHAFDEGFVRPGDTVVDPFAGVSLGALPCLLHGLNVLHVELEPKFHALAQANVARWQQRYGQREGYGQAVLLQGDSRQLAALVEGQVVMVASSPPYAGLGMQEQSPTIDTPPRPGDVRQYRRKAPIRDYGTTPGQLAALPECHITWAISSPPYADGCAHTGGTDPQPQHIQGGELRYVAYGGTPGQRADAVVSFPPWKNQEGGKGAHKFADPTAFAAYMSQHTKGHGARPEAYLRDFERQALQQYGTTTGQLGITQKDTFWKAAKAIVEQVFQVLRPGGCAIWVTKNYVRNGAIVDFTGDWARLCQHVGFEWLHHHQALLTEAHGTQRDLFGADQVQSTARISFFRRLHQAKYPHLAITHESVLCFRKPSLEASHERHS